MVPHSVLLKGGGSPPIKRPAHASHRQSPPSHQLCDSSCRVMKYQFAGTFIFANATQVKWSVQVCLFQQYSYGSRPQCSSKTANDFVLRHEGESKTRGWNQKSRGKEGQACV
ncbi:hypothetical protein Bca4012_089663 [Brassica carinata]|uniref:Uncharacterized protein n=1 Tax=Brassica oleracea var. oleracea TaxID=109376 RepID=A0A0D3AAG5_BRAOL